MAKEAYDKKRIWLITRGKKTAGDERMVHLNKK